MVWFYAAGGEKLGPHSVDDIETLLLQGRIGGDTKIWNAELENWRVLREVETFAAALARVTPPPLDAPSAEPAAASPPSLLPSPPRPVTATLRAGDAGVWGGLAAVLGFVLLSGWFGWRLLALIQLDVVSRQAAKAPMAAMVESLIWLDPSALLAGKLALFAVAAWLSLRLLRRVAASLPATETRVAPGRIGRVWFAVPGMLWRPPGLVRALLADVAGRSTPGQTWLVRIWWIMFGLAGVLAAFAVFLAIKAYMTPNGSGGFIDGKHIGNGAAIGVALMAQGALVLASLMWSVVVLKLGQVRLIAAAAPSSPSAPMPVGAASAAQPARLAGLGRVPKPVLLGAGVLVLALVGWLALDGGGTKGPPPGWKKTVSRDAVTDAQVTRLIGHPRTVNGVIGRTPSFTISCGTRGVGLGVDFGLALEDAFPDGKADMVRVTVRADQGTPRALGFLPSRDWNSAFAIDQNSLGAGLTSLAVDMLSGLMPSARGLNTRWKAIDLVRMMAGSRQFVLRAPTRTGTDITLTFEMESYNRLLAELPPRCR